MQPGIQVWGRFIIRHIRDYQYQSSISIESLNRKQASVSATCVDLGPAAN